MLFDIFRHKFEISVARDKLLAELLVHNFMAADKDVGPAGFDQGAVKIKFCIRPQSDCFGVWGISLDKCFDMFEPENIEQHQGILDAALSHDESLVRQRIYDHLKRNLRPEFE